VISPNKMVLDYIIGDVINYSLRVVLKVGIEESIVNAPLGRLQSKNTNNAKSEVRFNQLLRDAFTIDS
jgi:hypothetical protein